MKRVKCVLLALLVMVTQNSYAAGADLTLSPADLFVLEGQDGGFHLYIRKKPGLGSVLLTESTRDPALLENNYAFRAAEWNPVNGDEIRILNGQVIPREEQIWSLVDSTPEPPPPQAPELGDVFHIFIPYELQYGYENTRHGIIKVGNGTYFNIRAFFLPYADYNGDWADNSFVLQVTQKPTEGPPKGAYLADTEKSFTGIAVQNRGKLIHSKGPEDLLDNIDTLLTEERGKSLDLVLCVDTTSSMRSYLEEMKGGLMRRLQSLSRTQPGLRVSLVLFRDYYDEYIVKRYPFTRDLNTLQRSLNEMSARGGRDIPEAVNEALYEAVTKQEWEAERRLVILIGDAPPHAEIRNNISPALVAAEAAERDVKISCLLLPQ